MNCAEIESLICEYVDGTLAPAPRAAVEEHLRDCANCAEMARDAAAAVAFIERAAVVEAPPELVTRILFDPPWQKRKRSWFGNLLQPVLQPRFAMGMALTILSLSMVVPHFRQLQPSDLEPLKIWAGLEDRAYRMWERSLKFYDNLKIVYQIQATLRDWQQEQEARPAVETAPPRQPDDRKLPVHPVPQTEAPPAAARPGKF